MVNYRHVDVHAQHDQNNYMKTGHGVAVEMTWNLVTSKFYYSSIQDLILIPFILKKKNKYESVYVEIIFYTHTHNVSKFILKIKFKETIASKA